MNKPFFAALLCCLSLLSFAQTKPEPTPKPQPNAPATPSTDNTQQRTQLNLLGQTDASSGESRRNENVQFNLIDNNALRELNLRVGTTATLVEEFKAERNYFGTEYGNPPAPVVHLPNARNSKGIHGSLFETHNNSIFSARAFFQIGDVKPARENNYGLNLSLPLWQKKSRNTFLTLDATQQKVRGIVNGNALVPTADQRAPLTNDPVLRPIVARYLAAYRELPNRGGNFLNANAPQFINTDGVSARLDHQLKARDRLALRYGFTGQTVLPFQFVAGQNPDTFTKSHTGRISWNRTWSANAVTDVSIGFDRVTSLLQPEKNAVGPTVGFGGALTGLGPAPPLPINRAQNLFRYAASFAQTRGNHRLTAGGEVTRVQVNGSEPDGIRGIVTFANDFGRDAITNLRMGTPSQYVIALGNVHRGFRNGLANVYVGDSWRVSKRFNVNAGLRYGVVTQPSEVNQLNRFNYDCDCNNFAPQLGWAYQLSERLGVMRGAYGLHYGQIFPITFGQIRLTVPGSYRLIVNQPDLRNPLAGIDVNNLPANTRGGLYEFADDFVTPYAHQYNLSWEPNLTRHAKFQFGYVGSRAHKLFQMWFLNRARVTPGIDQATRTINQRRPDTRYLEIFRSLNGSRGYYDAARASVILNEWRGFTLDASYWFSKSLDIGNDYSNTISGPDSRNGRSQSEFNVHQDLKGLSSFDQPHALLVRTSYTFPKLARQRALAATLGAWNFSFVGLLKNGTPFTVESGSDAPGFGNIDGQGSDRPHLLDQSILGRTFGDPDQRIPRAAFAYIQPTELSGSLGRNTFRRGHIANVNAALAKTWNAPRQLRFNFRAESINLFNTPQFAEPVKELASPSFGLIQNTLNDGRTFRFTLRLSF